MGSCVAQASNGLHSLVGACVTRRGLCHVTGPDKEQIVVLDTRPDIYLKAGVREQVAESQNLQVFLIVPDV